MALSSPRLWPLLLACWALPLGECCCLQGSGVQRGGDDVARGCAPRESQPFAGHAGTPCACVWEAEPEAGDSMETALRLWFVLTFDLMAVINTIKATCEKN